MFTFFISRSTVHIDGLKILLLFSVFLAFLATFVNSFGYTKRGLIIQVILYTCMAISVINNRRLDILQLVMIILVSLNSINMDFKYLLKFNFWCLLTMYSIITLSAILGIINTEILTHSGLDQTVNTYGFTYYNIPSLSIFTILILYVVLKDKINFIDIFLYLVVSFWAYKVYTQRLLFILLLFYIFMYLLFRYKDISSNIFFSAISYFLPLVMTVISFTLAYIYKVNASSLYTLDNLLNGRIGLTLQAFNLYKITIWGQPFTWTTGDEIKFIGNYFFLDNAYAYALLAYGLIFLLGLIIEYTSILIFLQKNSELKLYLWIVVVVIGGTIVFDWLLNIIFSPCLYLIIRIINKKNVL